MTTEYRHKSVMPNEVMELLDPKPKDVILDCTLGGAGHFVPLARRVGAQGLAVGIDQDSAALQAARQRLDAEDLAATCILVKGNFGDLDELLLGLEIPGVDRILFDLGVSSPQLDVPERGFSYREDAPLDMRMDPQKQELNAAGIVNSYPEADLARILSEYADEKFASRISHRIAEVRSRRPILRTGDLAAIVKDAIPAVARRSGHHPAKKTFQALRMEVNGELRALEQGLCSAIRWLNPTGRICVISYHSAEDRLVKHIFTEHAKTCTCPPDLPVCRCNTVPILKVVSKKPMTPSEEEVQENPRARSALLRVAEKL